MKRKLNQYIRKSLLVAVTFILVFCNAVTYVNGQQYQLVQVRKLNILAGLTVVEPGQHECIL